jgi:hypothetical protein
MAVSGDDNLSIRLQGNVIAFLNAAERSRNLPVSAEVFVGRAVWVETINCELRA